MCVWLCKIILSGAFNFPSLIAQVVPSSLWAELISIRLKQVDCLNKVNVARCKNGMDTLMCGRVLLGIGG